MRFAVCLFCLMVTFGVSQVIAQPEILDIDGSINHGETVSLVGDDLGFKSPAAPLRYDDFEDGTIATRLRAQDDGGWYTFEHSGTRPSYSQGMQRIPGEMCALQDYSDSYNQTIGLKYLDVDTLYVSGWTYRDDFDGTASYSENVKFWGNFTHMEGGTASAPQNRYDAYWSNNSGHLYVSVESGTNGADGQYAGARSYLDEWFRLERWMAIGNPGEPNGVTWASHNGNKFAEIAGVFHNTSTTYNYWLIGQYFRKNPYSNPELPTASVKTYWGELYVDNTLARVEIGNNEDFESCTHREIQIPEKWENNMIDFRINQGTFAQGEELFLFVIDASGAPSVGFPIVMNSEVVMEGPGIPSVPQRF